MESATALIVTSQDNHASKRLSLMARFIVNMFE